MAPSCHRCCELEAVDETLAIHGARQGSGAYVARDPPLCFEDTFGGSSFEQRLGDQG